jgi:hypothetical protein
MVFFRIIAALNFLAVLSECWKVSLGLTNLAFGEGRCFQNTKKKKTLEYFKGRNEI